MQMITMIKVLKAVSLWVAKQLHRLLRLCTLKKLTKPRHMSTGTCAYVSLRAIPLSSTEDQQKGCGWLATRAKPSSHNLCWETIPNGRLPKFSLLLGTTDALGKTTKWVMQRGILRQFWGG